MAKKEPQTILEEGPVEAPSDRKSTEIASKELSEREAFTGDEKFYDFMARQRQVQVATDQPGKKQKSSQISSLLKRFSTLQKVLVFGIIVAAAMFLYAILRPASEFGAVPITRQTTLPKTPAAEDSVQVQSSQVQKPQFVPPTTQPLSLKVAQDFYLQKDYVTAFDIYNQLRQGLPTGEESNLLRDFLQLKMALCIRKTGDLGQAHRLFRGVSESRSPLIRILANYYLSFIDVQKGRYLKARAGAYQTIALINAVDLDGGLPLLLLRDCHFLITESVTRYILSLCDIDKDIPDRLWSSPVEVDPFSGINEVSGLSGLLNSGSERLSKGLLAPQIQKIEHPGAPTRWSVICQGASIEELLARFATNAKIDITWVPGKEEGSEKAKDFIRNRPVILYLPAATTQQAVAIAAGSVGLLARLDEQRLVKIFNPDEYSSLSEFVSFLAQEAMSLWQSFLLSFYDDQRVPNAHFALGILQAQRGQITESIAEYKLVANRYSQTNLAPFALLHSSKLKADIRDHLGAREDLKQLVEQYPDSELSNRANLYLADATMKAGFLSEAARLYRKVYYLGLSNQAQAVAAFGAAKCYNELKDYEAAAKWLTRYINLAKEQESRELYLAYFLLGKINLTLGNLQQACIAFQCALTGDLSREKYIETISALVEAQIRQEHFIEALTLIDGMHPWQFTQKESTEILLVRSKILRTMGLVDKAISVLGDRAEYIPDPQLKAKVCFELTGCYITKGNLELARRELAEILVFVEPGPLAQEVAFELADVCLKLGENSQAVYVCTQLLESGPSEQIKQKALGVLASVYKQQKSYNEATLVLLGQWDGVEPTNEKKDFDSPDASSQLLKQTQ